MGIVFDPSKVYYLLMLDDILKLLIVGIIIGAWLFGTFYLGVWVIRRGERKNENPIEQLDSSPKGGEPEALQPGRDT